MEAASHTRHGPSRQQHRRMRTAVETDREIGDLGGGLPVERSKPKKQLNFYQAMSDFQTMFPHIEKDVIEAVLRANDGVVQTTIDQLLMLSDGAETDGNKQDDVPHLPNYNESQTYEDDPPPAYSEVESQILNEFVRERQEFQHQGQPDSTDNLTNRVRERSTRWNPALLGPLPPDFLRLSDSSPERPFSEDSMEVTSQCIQETAKDNFLSDKDLEQFLEDEKLAMFLQNEEFMRQLRRDPDFLMSLEEDHRRFVHSQSGPVVADGAASPPEHGAKPIPSGGARPRYSNTTGHDDVAFNRKLKHMGKSTRKRLAKMAKKFSRKNSSPVASSTANLLEEDSENEDSKGLEGIQENEDEVSHDRAYRRMPNNDMNGGRRLPQVPTERKRANNEPIVFYNEDDEFSYKSD
eukprot:gene15512-6775_t